MLLGRLGANWSFAWSTRKSARAADASRQRPAAASRDAKARSSTVPLLLLGVEGPEAGPTGRKVRRPVGR
jgi:hypothetical protein